MEAKSPPTNAQDTSDFWRKHYLASQDSYVSKKKYCKEHSLIYPRFIYWSRKFAAEATTTLTPNPSFIKVNVESSSSNSVLCTLELGGSKRLLVHDVTALKAILNCME